MKIAIVGSRGFDDYELLKSTISDYLIKTYCKDCQCNKKYCNKGIITILSGGARGADSLAEKFADEFEMPKEIFPALWRVNGVYDPAAGFKRNHDIIKNADVVFAFWDGKSRGTKHSIELAGVYKKKIKVVQYE